MTLGQLTKTFCKKLAEKKFFAFKNLQKMHIEPVRVGVAFSNHELSYGSINEDYIKDILIQRMLVELKKHMVMTVTDKQSMSNPTTEYQATIFIGTQ